VGSKDDGFTPNGLITVSGNKMIFIAYNYRVYLHSSAPQTSRNLMIDRLAPLDSLQEQRWNRKGCRMQRS
jgi:hypothetical protein